MSKIGILALQGDFEKHAVAVKKLKHDPLLVKDRHTLESCDRLIIPGGESTTFMKLIDRLELRQPLISFGSHKPVFGTCAGLIILSDSVNNHHQETLKLIEISVERNAYGRQIDSFVDNVDLDLKGKKDSFEAVFIRAPKITNFSGKTKPVAWYKNDVVMAENERILVASFHPELTDDLRIHDYFLNNFA